MTITVWNLMPQWLNANGDAENARVLAQRARWSGIDAQVVAEHNARPDAVVIGSGFDGDIEQIAQGLRAAEKQLSEAMALGVPILAIGLGFELLGESVMLQNGTRVAGLGLIAGEALALDQRATGDLIVNSEHGLLVGFENHSRGYELSHSAQALGDVVHGVGNGASAREGFVEGSLIGSHLHGPLLAKNPAIADAILARATNGVYSADNPRARWADSLAEKARHKIFTRAGIAAPAPDPRLSRATSEATL